MVQEPRDGWPYLFCSNCKHITPVRTMETGHVECMACEFVVLPVAGGRIIYLSQEEARVRGLPVVKRN